MLLASIVRGGVRGEEFVAQRQALVEQIRLDRQQLGPEWNGTEFDPRVLRAIGKVPRHEFVKGPLKSSAYQDRPLPIGDGQTISQPFVVALMTDALGLKPGDRVLEIGTGSGYQAAILAELTDQVYTVENIAELAAEAAERLTRLGYSRVVTRVADGYHGWPEKAPFDAIIVTAAPPTVPPPLIDQLRPGGRLVIPVGSQSAPQQLQLIIKQNGGRITSRTLLPVAFVPLTRRR